MTQEGSPKSNALPPCSLIRQDEAARTACEPRGYKTKMRRYLLRSGLALAVLFLLSAKFVDLTIGAGFGHHPIETAWAATGLTADLFALDYWVTMPAQGEDKEILKELAAGLGRRLGAGNAAVSTGQTNRINYANLDSKMGDGGELILTIQNNSQDMQIGISYYYHGLPASVLSLERRIRASLRDLDRRGDFFWKVRGRQPGRLSASEYRTLSARVLSAVNAVRSDTDDEDNLVEAISPLLPAAVSGAANLAISSSYDRRLRCTMVTLSSER